jgi:hypothetical protein
VTALARCGWSSTIAIPLFIAAFGEVFKAEGLRIITTRPGTPTMNADCE